jgi:2-iminobutanoate/2-iminopropanoate deaminase
MPSEFERVPKRPITNLSVLNEAFCYDKPSAFSRGMRVELTNEVMLFISGTASVDEYGASINAGDFKAQAYRMFDNVTALLAAEGADWHDVARTTIYVADMRDYDALNDVRCDYYDSRGLTPYPASTCIEARICRPELLVEMEAIVIIPRNRPVPGQG